MILLDTHIVVWLNQEQDRISSRALEAISSARQEASGLGIADITLWEIAMGVAKQRIKIAVPLAEALEQVAALYRIFPISPKVAELSNELFKEGHSDPADRLIVATALAHKLPLITADRRILASGEVTCIW